MSMVDRLRNAREKARKGKNSTAQQNIPEKVTETADEALVDEIRENIQAQIAALRQLDMIITKYIETRG